ncbi:hypothetical protein [Arthrobacter sp. MYb227]|nr:hypothetical protein [Arthrobacter sp. MYb227]
MTEAEARIHELEQQVKQLQVENRDLQRQLAAAKGRKRQAFTITPG